MDVLDNFKPVNKCVVCDDKLAKDSKTFCEYHLKESIIAEREKSS